jgi:hypothetical protein
LADPAPSSLDPLSDDVLFSLAESKIAFAPAPPAVPNCPAGCEDVILGRVACARPDA